MVRVTGERVPFLQLFAYSLPVVAQMLLFMLLPGDLLADLCQSLFLEIRKKTKKKGLNLSDESHFNPLTSSSIKYRKKEVLKMSEQEGGKERK